MRRKVAVITGASSGIGRACAHRFAAAGYRLGVIARSREGLAAAAREAEANGSQALVIQGDVARDEDVERLASETYERFGGIDVWVNNAMVTVLSPVAEMAPEEFRRVIMVATTPKASDSVARRSLHRLAFLRRLESRRSPCQHGWQSLSAP